MASAELAGSANTTSEHRAQAGTGPFMLTLCRLAGPVSIQPPRSPQLKPFTLFTSRARLPDGSEALYLHMGFFPTLSDAERWLQAARGRYPNAVATMAPDALLRASPAAQPVAAEALTDTQVMKILEARRPIPPQGGIDEKNCEQVPLLRPDETSTRQALKEAVAQGAPVTFAVQLHWSAQPLDLGSVPALEIFKGYTLYATESRRDGRSRYFLRLGFFADPMSAKELAAQVRSKFASAAVVPIDEQEVARAREAGMDSSSIPCLLQQRVDRLESKPLVEPRRRAPRSAETLEDTLKQLAEREMWTDPDTLSDTGVRHLKVEVQEQERTSARS